ncbi:extracellular catalytic domain type 1 short-chain-length polyhydroxyalkanoate depolymerase [Nocardia arizonensis]|uniref:extracellular catalytic domain type 1 short-chain-length polyhydroxyalkanoate depolymerase n=1 Tax=Nocardia arizonensis TaxID=1141647 RepID=UPI0006D16D6A|nr:PHB depolymerase family esterase [Nocardia arizonensis]
MLAIAAAAAILLTVACGPSGADAADDESRTLDHGGTQRRYLIHHPENRTGAAVPAVLVFHGGGGTARNLADRSGFDRLSDTGGFVAVYPEGIDRSWNDGRGGDTAAGAAGVDDIGFVSALIDRLIATDNVDPARIYVTGMSNGAMFTQYLGCHLGARIAAIAPVAGLLPVAAQPLCAPGRPMPVLQIHGTGDPITPYDGGFVRTSSGHNGRPGTTPMLSVQADQAVWRAANNCAAPVTTALPPVADDGTSVTVRTAACPGNAEVVLYTVTNGGHTWPGGDQYLPEALIGKVSRQFDASEVIWRFFAAH